MPFKINIEEFNRKAKEILENEVIPQVEKYEQIKKNKLRELILSLEVRPMTHDEWEKTRLNAYKPVK